MQSLVDVCSRYLPTVRYFWLVLLANALAACASESDEAKMAQGAELLVPFKQELQTALKAGLAEGPVEAISACRIQAPQIAEALSTGGTRLGRTSHQLRNPDNSSPEWVSPVLAAYLENAEDRTARVVALPDGRSGYVEPIVLQPLCVTCHGEALAPEIAARIAELYPADRAVGFNVGDLRGVFWVEDTAWQ